MGEQKKVSAIQSIQGVMELVQAVAKRERNAAQGFNFRGIDAVVNAVAPALREVGGVIVPRVIDKVYDRGATKNGTPTVEAFLTVEFAWYGTDGGDPVIGYVASEAMDTSDKATAKAMSVALRTFLLQTLMLPTDEKDPDAEYHERKPVSKKPADVPAGFMALIEKAKDMDALRDLWSQAVQGHFESGVNDAITARKAQFNANS